MQRILPVSVGLYLSLSIKPRYWAFLTGKALNPVDDFFGKVLISPFIKNMVRARFPRVSDAQGQQADSVIGSKVLNRFAEG